MWTNNFDKCIACGKDEFPHVSKGLCKRCWDIHLHIKNKVDVSTPSKKEYKLSQRNKTKLIDNKWANNFDRCIKCGTTEILHASKGLCRRCYQASIESKHKHHNKQPKVSVTILTKEFLLREYIKNNKSLSDLAKECGCSRQFVFKKLKEYGIPGRKKRDARLMALEKDKISYTRTDKDGNVREVTHQKSEIDEYFFSYWSAPMAWVLGVIYADGTLDSGRRFGETAKIKQSREPRVSISQKEPEILEKIKTLMRSNQKLLFSKRREWANTTAGECYHLVIRHLQIFRDLTKIGLTPNKSLTITFPDVPKEYIWHFIRGCWDGDGCLSIDKASGQINAGYVSGSKVFIEKFVEILKRELSLEKISIFHRGNSYEFKLHTKNCLQLCHYLYDGVSPDLYLSRKFNVYMNYLEKSMSKEKYRCSRDNKFIRGCRCPLCSEPK